jgi:hypothetical protein
MRGIRALTRLIPQDLRDSLNANPIFQWFVLGLMMVVGVLLVLKGINGFKEKRLTGKGGRVFEGTTAQVLGVIYAIVGVLLAVGAVGMKLSS